MGIVARIMLLKNQLYKFYDDVEIRYRNNSIDENIEIIIINNENISKVYIGVEILLNKDTYEMCKYVVYSINKEEINDVIFSDYSIDSKYNIWIGGGQKERLDIVVSLTLKKIK